MMSDSIDSALDADEMEDETEAEVDKVPLNIRRCTHLNAVAMCLVALRQYVTRGM